MEDKFREKRSEPRMAASGTVRLHVAEAGSDSILAKAIIDGEMLDESAHGFRAAHAERGLATGQEIRFEYRGGIGRAKVMWNRIMESRVESGFLKL